MTDTRITELEAENRRLRRDIEGLKKQVAICDETAAAELDMYTDTAAQVSALQYENRRLIVENAMLRRAVQECNERMERMQMEVWGRGNY